MFVSGLITDLQHSKIRRVEVALERNIRSLIKDKGDVSLTTLFSRDQGKKGAMKEVRKPVRVE